MVTLNESPTLPGWERSSSLAGLGTLTIATVSSDKPSGRPDSGAWEVDDPSLTTLQVPRDALPVDELETLPKARAPHLDGDDVVTIPQAARRAVDAPLDDEPATTPMQRRSPLADHDDDVDTVTNPMPSRRSAAAPSSRQGPPPTEPQSPSFVEPTFVDEDSEGDLATVPANMRRPFEPELDAAPRVEGPIVDPRPSDKGLPVPPETPSAPEPASSFPGRAFGSQLAPTSQLDRPEGASVGGKAVSVLVAVAVVSLVLLATAMIITERSGIEAFTDLLVHFGLR